MVYEQHLCLLDNKDRDGEIDRGFMPYFGDVWRDLVSPVLLY